MEQAIRKSSPNSKSLQVPYLILKFLSHDGEVFLEATEFALSGAVVRRCVRGTNSVVPNVGTFRWNQAVRAICILALRYFIYRESDRAEDRSLAGGAGSLAASLDYSIAKNTAWLSEVFGSDSNGTSVVRKLITRQNPERKRPGPVVVAFTKSTLDMGFYLNREKLSSKEALHNLLTSLDTADRTADLPIQVAGGASRLPQESFGLEEKPAPILGGAENSHDLPEKLALTSQAAGPFAALVGIAGLQDLRFKAPTEIGVTTFIPFFHGDLSARKESIQTGKLLDGSPVNIKLFGDGYAVAVLRLSYFCRSVPDFLLQRRLKHLELLRIDLGASCLTNGRSSTAESSQFLTSPEKPFYVMSIHHLIDPSGELSEAQRLAIAEPSLAGITDDPELPTPEERDLEGLETLNWPPDTFDSLDKLTFGSTSYYISWANVFAVYQKHQPDQAVALESLEIQLQHVWCRIYHLVESLSQRVARGISLSPKVMEKCTAHYNDIRGQYEAFRRIRATASTDAISLRRSLEKTSKLEMIFNELARCYQGLFEEDQRAVAFGE